MLPGQCSKLPMAIEPEFGVRAAEYGWFNGNSDRAFAGDISLHQGPILCYN